MPSTPTLLLITFSTWTLQLSMKPPLSGRLSSQLSHMPLMSCPYKLYTHKGLILLIWILKIMLLRPVYCQNIGPFNQRWVSRSTAYNRHSIRFLPVLSHEIHSVSCVCWTLQQVQRNSKIVFILYKLFILMQHLMIFTALCWHSCQVFYVNSVFNRWWFNK